MLHDFDNCFMNTRISCHDFYLKIQNVVHTIGVVIYEFCESNYGMIVLILYLLIMYVCTVSIVLSRAKTNFTLVGP